MSALPAAPRRAPRRAPTPRPQLRLVGTPRHARRHVVVMIALGAAAIFACVALNALAAEQAFAARELEGDVEELSLRYDELTMEVAKLESPARVRRVATDNLGMVQAQQPGYLVLDDSSRVTPTTRRARQRSSAPRQRTSTQGE
ncbi:MAG: hypothetical protein ACRDU8_06270 [Egibacteraceae bacterium]